MICCAGEWITAHAKRETYRHEPLSDNTSKRYKEHCLARCLPPVPMSLLFAHLQGHRGLGDVGRDNHLALASRQRGKHTVLGPRRERGGYQSSNSNNNIDEDASVMHY